MRVIDEATEALLSMREISRYLFLAGALPFILLGLAHAAATPHSPAQAKGLSPRDPGLRDAMAQGSILLTRRTTLWLAWVGFNLSHSLGAVVFGLVVVLVGRSVLVSSTYLFLGLRYWFRTPIVGILSATVCFLASWGLLALAG